MTTTEILGIIVTALIGVVSMTVTVLFSMRTNKSQKLIRELISKITGLFSASQRMGIETAYENRENALASSKQRSLSCPLASGPQDGFTTFVSRFREERKLIVVGSSLLGLKVYVNHPSAILRSRANSGYETKFMLTQPCFSGLREDQEGRSEGEIKKEIEDTLRFLIESCSIDTKDIRFYRGTPTCFLVITSEAMLLNPYPYQIESYSSFCLEVKKMKQQQAGRTDYNEDDQPMPAEVDKEYFGKQFMELMDSKDGREYNYSLDVGPDIYGQYYWYHYLLPWFSRQAVTYEDYRYICEKCPCLGGGYSKQRCLLLQLRKTSLFSVSLDSQDDLDKGNIPEELRKKFEEEGISLSSNLHVLTEEKDSTWSVTGSDNTGSDNTDKKIEYIVRKLAGVLSVYEKRKHDLVFQKDLDDGRIPKKLRDEFEKEGILLASNSTVSTKEKDRIWFVTSTDTEGKEVEYTVRMETDTLNIYKRIQSAGQREGGINVRCQ